MLVELVETTTQDGMTLHGALHQPPRGQISGEPLDAILLLHGVGSNFYSSTLLAALAQQFAGRGLTTLRANTRGHDFVSLARSAAGPQRQGAAYETVGRCHYDIEAWHQLLGQRGARRIGIVGHSLGAVKAVYATALHPHPATCRVVAVSPPRLSYSALMQGPRSTLFAKTMARAQGHVDEGKPATLMRVTYPFPLLITAIGYLEKYGPAETYNVLRFASQLPCPALFTFGQQELDSGSAAFAGMPQALRTLPTPRWPLQSVTIAGANHLYEGHDVSLAKCILDWLEDLPEQSGGGGVTCE